MSKPITVKTHSNTVYVLEDSSAPTLDESVIGKTTAISSALIGVYGFLGNRTPVDSVALSNGVITKVHVKAMLSAINNSNDRQLIGAILKFSGFKVMSAACEPTVKQIKDFFSVNGQKLYKTGKFDGIEIYKPDYRAMYPTIDAFLSSQILRTIRLCCGSMTGAFFEKVDTDWYDDHIKSLDSEVALKVNGVVDSILDAYASTSKVKINVAGRKTVRAAILTLLPFYTQSRLSILKETSGGIIPMFIDSSRYLGRAHGRSIAQFMFETVAPGFCIKGKLGKDGDEQPNYGSSCVVARDISSFVDSVIADMDVIRGYKPHIVPNPIGDVDSRGRTVVARGKVEVKADGMEKAIRLLGALNMHSAIPGVMALKSGWNDVTYVEAGELGIRETTTYPMYAMETLPSEVRCHLAGDLDIDMEACVYQGAIEVVRKAMKTSGVKGDVDAIIRKMVPIVHFYVNNKTAVRDGLAAMLEGQGSPELSKIIKRALTAYAYGGGVSYSRLVSNDAEYAGVSTDLVNHKGVDVTPAAAGLRAAAYAFLDLIKREMDLLTKYYAKLTTSKSEVKVSARSTMMNAVLENESEFRKKAREIGITGLYVHDGIATRDLTMEPSALRKEFGQSGFLVAVSGYEAEKNDQAALEFASLVDYCIDVCLGKIDQSTGGLKVKSLLNKRIAVSEVNANNLRNGKGILAGLCSVVKGDAVGAVSVAYSVIIGTTIKVATKVSVRGNKAFKPTSKSDLYNSTIYSVLGSMKALVASCMVG